MMDVDGRSLQSDLQPKLVGWLGLWVGGHLALSLRSSNEPGELSQWLCTGDCAVNIDSCIVVAVVVIIIIVIIIIIMTILHTTCLLLDLVNQEEALPMWITRPKTRESNDSVRLD